MIDDSSSSSSDLRDFGKTVKEYLRKKNWNQARLSAATSFSAGYISKVVHGRQNIGPANVRTIASQLSIPIDDVPHALRWPLDESETLENEHRQALRRYFGTLNRLERLPYSEALRRKLRIQKLRPPELTTVFVRPEYRTETDSLNKFGGALPGMRQQGLENAIKANKHVVLQGSPGSGKSSIVSNLTIQAARDFEQEGSELSWIPIPIVAREFSAQRADYDFHDCLSLHLKKRFGIELSAEMFQAPPPNEASDWLIMLDGIDEIVDLEGRNRLIDDVLSFSRNPSFPYKFLITSRPMAEMGDLRGEEFGRYILLPFKDSQIKEFVSRWFLAMSPDRADELAGAFMSWLSQGGLGDIATSPAMLTIAAVVYQLKENSISNQRIDLYQEYIDLMLSADLKPDWNIGVELRELLHEKKGYGDEGIRFAGNLFAMQREIYQQIALHLQDNPQLNIVELARDIVQSSDWIKEAPADLSSNDHQLEQFIEEMMRGSGVLEDSFGSFSFVHNTIREFLAAEKYEQEILDSRNTWGFVRFWGDARWREIVLFFLSLRSRRSPESKSEVSNLLEQISSTGPRGIHFAGTALAEGVLVLDDTGDLIVDSLIERAKRWNLCAEILAEFASPDVTEVLRMLVNHPRIRTAIFSYIRSGGNGCPKSLRALFDFSEEIADLNELEELAKNASALWVRVGALTGLLSCGATDAATEIVRKSLPRLGSTYGIDIVLALHAAGAMDELRWIVGRGEASKIVRLTALLHLDDEVDRQGLPDIHDLIATIDDWEPLTGDVLAKLASQHRIGEVLASNSLEKSHGIKMCKVLAEIGYIDSASGYLLECLEAGGTDERISAAKILATLNVGEDILEKLDSIAYEVEDDIATYAQFAEVLARLGNRRHLDRVLGRKGVKAEILISVAKTLGKFFDADAAMLELRRIAESGEVTDSLEIRRLVGAAFSVDPSPETIQEAVSWSENRDEHGYAGIDNLFKLGLSPELFRQALNEKMGNAQRKRAIKCLGELGQGEKLLELARSKALDGELRLLCLECIVKLGWREEAAQVLLLLADETSSKEDELRILSDHRQYGSPKSVHSRLRRIRDNEVEPLERRFEAARVLGGSPWNEVLPSKLLTELLEREWNEDDYLESLRWCAANILTETPEENSGLASKSIERKLISVLLSKDVKPSVSENIVDTIYWYAKDLYIPDEAIDNISLVPRGLYYSRVLEVLQRQDRSQKVIELLDFWSEQEIAATNRIEFAKLAVKLGSKSTAVNMLSPFILGDFEGLWEFEEYIRLVTSAAEMETAVEALKKLSSSEDVYYYARAMGLRQLAELGALSSKDARDHIMRFWDDENWSVGLKLDVYLQLAAIGEASDDQEKLKEILEDEETSIEDQLRACEALRLSGCSDFAYEKIIELCQDGELKITLPACSQLLRSFPRKTEITAVKNALGAWGKFEIEDLVEVCKAAQESELQEEIHAEFLSFVGHVDFPMGDMGVDDLIRSLVEEGLGYLAGKLTRWMTREERRKLADGWELEPDLVQSFVLGAPA